MPRNASDPGRRTAEPFLRGLRIGTVCIAAATLLPLGLIRNVAVYRPLALELLAYAVLIAVVLAEVRLITHGRSWGAARGPTLALVLGTSVVALVALPPGTTTSSANWAFGVIGWFGLILLLDLPLGWLAAFLAVHETITVVAVLAPGVPETAILLNLVVGSLGAIGFPLACGVAATALRAVAAEAERTARAAQQVRTADAVAAEIHHHRQQRFTDLYDTAVPLLQGLADGALHAGTPTVQRACAIEAARMRRLFAESDEAPDPLLHELRQCVEVAERRGVLVELETSGRWQPPPLEVRRALTDAPLAALATAVTQARVTIVGAPDVLAVSVVADCASIDLPAGTGTHVDVVTARASGMTWVEAQWTPA